MKLTDLRARSWAALETYVGGLGVLLGPMLAVLGRSWASMGGLEPLLGPLCPVLGCSWSLCWRSWAALGAYVGCLGSLSGPMLAILGRSQGLSGQSWDAFGPKEAVLGGIRPESGQNPSGSVIWPKGSGPHNPHRPP